MKSKLSPIEPLQITDKITRKQRITPKRYWRRFNDCIACLAVACIIVLIAMIAIVKYVQYLDAHYQTKQQKVQEVHDKLMAIQQASHVPMYHISVTYTN